jgi:uncharacterized protein
MFCLSCEIDEPAGWAPCGIMESEFMSRVLEFGATKIDSASLDEVCRRYGVKELSLFGSAVRGEMGRDSDIDFLVEFEPGVRVGLIKFESLVEDLTALAGFRVDLVTKRGLKPWVRAEILKTSGSSMRHEPSF